MGDRRTRPEPRTYNLTRNYNAKRPKLLYDNMRKKAKPMPQAPTVAYLLDSGAYSIKAGSSTSESPLVVPNCIMKAKSERKRPFIGDQIEECRDLSGLFYLLPSERGYVVKWDVQKPIWDYVFQRVPLLPEKPLIMTQPIMNFKSIQECMDEIFFEEYDVKSLCRLNPTDLVQHAYVETVKKADVDCVVVDSGYSFTHVVPYINGEKYYPGLKRIDVGGKLLTNYLKDIISYRQLHVMEETHVINQVKEDTCFVSQDLKEDMRISSPSSANNTIVTNYVLPDFNNIRRGYKQDTAKESDQTLEGYQVLKLNNERFTVPELLFRPSNIGMEQKGIAETIVQSILLCPAENHAALAGNIIISGGNANFPGMRERLEKDVQSLSPSTWTIKVYKPEQPIEFAWLGGKALASNPGLHSILITKQEYEEHGSSYTIKKFNNLNLMQKEEKSNLEEQPVAESPYSHLYGKGSVVSQLQNYLEVGNSIRTTALELIKDAAAESALEARSPKWNDSLTQQVLSDMDQKEINFPDFATPDSPPPLKSQDPDCIIYDEPEFQSQSTIDIEKAIASVVDDDYVIECFSGLEEPLWTDAVAGMDPEVQAAVISISDPLLPSEPLAQLFPDDVAAAESPASKVASTTTVPEMLFKLVDSVEALTPEDIQPVAIATDKPDSVPNVGRRKKKGDINNKLPPKKQHRKKNKKPKASTRDAFTQTSNVVAEPDAFVDVATVDDAENSKDSNVQLRFNVFAGQGPVADAAGHAQSEPPNPPEKESALTIPECPIRIRIEEDGQWYFETSEMPFDDIPDELLTMNSKPVSAEENQTQNTLLPEVNREPVIIRPVVFDDKPRRGRPRKGTHSRIVPAAEFEAAKRALLTSVARKRTKPRILRTENKPPKPKVFVIKDDDSQKLAAGTANDPIIIHSDDEAPYEDNADDLATTQFYKNHVKNVSPPSPEQLSSPPRPAVPRQAFKDYQPPKIAGKYQHLVPKNKPEAPKQSFRDYVLSGVQVPQPASRKSASEESEYFFLEAERDSKHKSNSLSFRDYVLSAGASTSKAEPVIPLLTLAQIEALPIEKRLIKILNSAAAATQDSSVKLSDQNNASDSQDKDDGEK